LLYFTSPRTRRIRKRRLRLRHAALSLVALGLCLWLAGRTGAPESASIGPAVMAAADLPAAPQDVMPAGAASSLKAAFDATPAAPAYEYMPRDEDSAPPKAAAAPEAPALARQISSIQNGITRILEASSDFVSQKQLAVGKGDTLMDILVRNHVPRDEAYDAIAALSKVYDPRDLNPGRDVTVFFHRDPALSGAKFSGLRIEKDTVNSVVVNRAEDGTFIVNQEAKTVHRQVRAYRAKIDNSLYVDAQAAGVPDAVILSLIRMYSWGVDFQREIQPGDAFEVMYEEHVTDDGVPVPGKGQVLYAKLDLSDREMPLYFFEDSAGAEDFFDPSGQSAKKPLMKTPIDGARISSGFGMRRHPVLGYSKMHKGMDFAAPRGTPIYAAGDGVIERAGRFSSYGNYVRIRHRAGLQTAYAHMNGFKKGIRAGSRVKQGEVIGYVGTTGRSTGPHLHYEILMSGRQVNPATVKIAGGRSLGGKDLKSFKSMVGKRQAEFEAATRKAAAPAVARN
jgi:murein DD-endopeptidase MepM/ murein hydrolase activator NlpD